jgi:hypothetical protein
MPGSRRQRCMSRDTDQAANDVTLIVSYNVDVYLQVYTLQRLNFSNVFTSMAAFSNLPAWAFVFDETPAVRIATINSL